MVFGVVLSFDVKNIYYWDILKILKSTEEKSNEKIYAFIMHNSIMLITSTIFSKCTYKGVLKKVFWKKNKKFQNSYIHVLHIH